MGSVTAVSWRSRRPLTAHAQDHPQASLGAICGVFLSEYFSFPSNIIPPLLVFIHTSITGTV